MSEDSEGDLETRGREALDLPHPHTAPDHLRKHCLNPLSQAAQGQVPARIVPFGILLGRPDKAVGHIPFVCSQFRSTKPGPAAIQLAPHIEVVLVGWPNQVLHDFPEGVHSQRSPDELRGKDMLKPARGI